MSKQSSTETVLFTEGQRNPDIEKGTLKQFIVRSINFKTGKIKNHAAYYLNEMLLHMDSGCNEEGCMDTHRDGCPQTGWYTDNSNPDFDHCYWILEEDVLQWANFPNDALDCFNLIEHLHRQRKFSEKTFGPGARVAGVTDHIMKELAEVRENPCDLSEWMDVVLLALDGAWRAGFSPEEITEALEAKQTKNESRNWPDWRTAPQDRAIEHKKSVREAV